MKHLNLLLLKGFVVSVVSCGGGSDDGSNHDQGQSPTTPVALFANANFEGESQEFEIGEYTFAKLSKVGDNKASSIKVPPHLTAYVCEYSTELGACKIIKDDQANLDDLDDKISYIRVVSREDQIQFQEKTYESKSCTAGKKRSLDEDKFVMFDSLLTYPAGSFSINGETAENSQRFFDTMLLSARRARDTINELNILSPYLSRALLEEKKVELGYFDPAPFLRSPDDKTVEVAGGFLLYESRESSQRFRGRLSHLWEGSFIHYSSSFEKLEYQWHRDDDGTETFTMKQGDKDLFTLKETSNCSGSLTYVNEDSSTSTVDWNVVSDQIEASLRPTN
ncbi:hypothetical protein [Pseudobacteriovorax antillogorgiicola]|uniref:Beta/gamma crystallin 'Greek key' domain-containing protein n=1 Tax=Pseudobacteriovorax antillogorgiicola TaxID=1513793 RepID=A0A1Y6B986_9BACT|nr:hypothetical protein [Pseudobacteriovorax antillogorgiicola]TCS58555.1 hypothetical protein EDD56_10268 [Pseudobacteriovorax antillogorgiicola]SME97647.1 hypothetical protein SAMN06296036_102375 [Pseudobacteriovorax antillogorgiicola]